jgi:hypothetical protein
MYRYICINMYIYIPWRDSSSSTSCVRSSWITHYIYISRFTSCLIIACYTSHTPTTPCPLVLNHILRIHIPCYRCHKTAYIFHVTDAYSMLHIPCYRCNTYSMLQMQQDCIAHTVIHTVFAHTVIQKTVLHIQSYIFHVTDTTRLYCTYSHTYSMLQIQQDCIAHTVIHIPCYRCHKTVLHITYTDTPSQRVPQYI